MADCLGSMFSFERVRSWRGLCSLVLTELKLLVYILLWRRLWLSTPNTLGCGDSLLRGALEFMISG